MQSAEPNSVGVQQLVAASNIDPPQVGQPVRTARAAGPPLGRGSSGQVLAKGLAALTRGWWGRRCSSVLLSPPDLSFPAEQQVDGALRRGCSECHQAPRSCPDTHPPPAPRPPGASRPEPHTQQVRSPPGPLTIPTPGHSCAASEHFIPGLDNLSCQVLAGRRSKARLHLHLLSLPGLPPIALLRLCLNCGCEGAEGTHPALQVAHQTAGLKSKPLRSWALLLPCPCELRRPEWNFMTWPPPSWQRARVPGRQASLTVAVSPCRAGPDDSEVFRGEAEPEAAPGGKSLSCLCGGPIQLTLCRHR